MLKTGTPTRAHPNLKILETSEQKPVFRKIVEKTRDEDVCHCQQSSSLVLFTNYQESDYCIRCGDCGEWVPLYRLPYIKEQEAHDALSQWQSTYAKLDRLFMQCFIGERFSYEQMSQPNSDLMKWGRELAAEISTKTYQPVYTFLMQYSTALGDHCPRCGSYWALSEKWHDYDFRCETCHMVSTSPPEDPLPGENFHP